MSETTTISQVEIKTTVTRKKKSNFLKLAGILKDQHRALEKKVGCKVNVVELRDLRLDFIMVR